MKFIPICLVFLFVLKSIKANDGIYWKDEEVPQGITIRFPPGEDLQYGAVAIPKNSQTTPEAKWTPSDNTKYSIAIINPDIVLHNEPNTNQFLHWLVVNISGNDLKSGTTLVPFMGPHPFKNTGSHRHTVFLFEQKKNNPLEANQVFEQLGKTFIERSQFNVRKFADTNQLGSPTAATYFTAEWEPFVDEILQEHFKLKK